MLYGFPSEGEQGRATEPVKIPEEVYRGLEYVRESKDMNVMIENNEIAAYKVNMAVTFVLEVGEQPG